MFTRKLLPLTASLLLTGITIFALAELSNSASQLVPSASLDGLPVTNLPGITVSPGVASSVDPHDEATPVANLLETGRDSAIDTASGLAGSNLRMPYYSFASASMHILEKD